MCTISFGTFPSSYLHGSTTGLRAAILCLAAQVSMSGRLGIESLW